MLAPDGGGNLHAREAGDDDEHGDSDWADAYNWPVDVADIVTVVRSLGRPCHLLGHSKGGGQATDAARIVPELVLRLVNIDGFEPPPFNEDPAALPERFAQYLDGRRRRGAQHAWRPYGSLEDLIERRTATIVSPSNRSGAFEPHTRQNARAPSGG